MDENRNIAGLTLLSLLITTLFASTLVVVGQRTPAPCLITDIEPDMVVRLGVAISDGDGSCVRKLLTHGVDPAAWYDGDLYSSPIVLATLLDHKEIVDSLFKAGLDPVSGPVAKAYFIAIDMKKSELVERMISAGVPVNCRDANGNTGLAHAAALGHVQMSQFLIRKGADPNAASPFGVTPLMNANNDAVVLELLEAGARLNQRSKIGWTALSYAVKAADKAKIVILMKKGADPCLKDNEGRTPLDIANKIENADNRKVLVNLLEKACSD